MFETEAHITSFAPGETGCLRCLYPEKPADWTRRFPVIGAVSGTAGCIGAMEAIKIVTGCGPTVVWSVTPLRPSVDGLSQRGGEGAGGLPDLRLIRHLFGVFTAKKSVVICEKPG